MGSVVSRLTIGHRTYGAFASLIALLLVVASVGYMGLGALSGTFAEFQHAAGQTVEIDKMTLSVAELRSASLQYRNQSGDSSQFIAVVDAIKFDDEAAVLLAGLSKTMADELKRLDEDSQSYTQVFGQAVQVEAIRQEILKR